MNSTLYGTSYFVSKRDAELYYRDYCETARDARALVAQKLADGEIHLGAPPKLNRNERLTTVDGGRRYAVIVGE